jgi:2-polyprenyl-3-methyl-5-hydroxy-6-metoxy-1,4-benzoquinol methylase
MVRCDRCGVLSTGRATSTQFDDSYFERFYREPADDVYHALLDAVGGQFPPGARALDVGCGAGHLLCALRERGHRGVGVDSSAAARRATSALGFPAHASLDELGEQRFDAAFALDVFAHVLPAADLARAVVACVAPGGLVVVKTPASPLHLARLELIATAAGRIDRSPFLHRASRTHHFDRAALARAMRAWGLHDVTVVGFPERRTRRATHGSAELAAHWIQRSVTRGGSLLGVGVRP